MSTFSAHLEYIYHVTCTKCKCYFSYAVMQKKFKMDRGEWFCPKCGVKGSVKVEEEI